MHDSNNEDREGHRRSRERNHTRSGVHIWLRAVRMTGPGEAQSSDTPPANYSRPKEFQCRIAPRSQKAAELILTTEAD